MLAAYSPTSLTSTAGACGSPTLRLASARETPVARPTHFNHEARRSSGDRAGRQPQGGAQPALRRLLRRRPRLSKCSADHTGYLRFAHHGDHHRALASAHIALEMEDLLPCSEQQFAFEQWVRSVRGRAGSPANANGRCRRATPARGRSCDWGG